MEIPSHGQINPSRLANPVTHLLQIITKTLINVQFLTIADSDHDSKCYIDDGMGVKCQSTYGRLMHWPPKSMEDKRTIEKYSIKLYYSLDRFQSKNLSSKTRKKEKEQNKSVSA